MRNTTHDGETEVAGGSSQGGFPLFTLTSAKLQIYGFAAAVLLLAALVVWAGHSAWRELQTLRANFAAARIEGFNLAEEIEARLLDLNETALRFDHLQDPAQRTLFNKDGVELRQYLVTQQANVSTPAERELLRQLEVALTHYLSGAAELMDGWKASVAIVNPTALERITSSAAPVLALVAKLKEAERPALNQFVTDSHEIVEGLQRLLIASVVLVVLLGFTAARLTYRARIAPLRAQIIESRALLERQEKLASLGTLAAGVAHEVRNPLTAINVRVHSLKRTLVEGTSEREDVGVIDDEIRRLDRIVRDFLDFARPSPPRLVTIHVESLFSRVQGLLGAQWKKSAIRFRVEPPPDLWVCVDTHQLEQVLINLVQNAADSIEGAGEIALRARAGHARLASGITSTAILDVADTGKGIPPEVQKRIFDPFFTTKENGTGLGLAIAASIVEKHHGALQCQTQVGRGTTFSIVLPRAEQSEHENQ